MRRVNEESVSGNNEVYAVSNNNSRSIGIIIAEVDALREDIRILKQRAPNPNTATNDHPQPTTTNDRPPPTASKSNRKSVICTICKKEYCRSDSLKRHMTAMHGNKPPRVIQDKRFECYTCRETFTQKTSLKRHVERFHLPPGNHKCLCGKIFVTQYNLKTHEAHCIFHKQSTSK